MEYGRYLGTAAAVRGLGIDAQTGSAVQSHRSGIFSVAAAIDTDICPAVGRAAVYRDFHRLVEDVGWGLEPGIAHESGLVQTRYRSVLHRSAEFIVRLRHQGKFQFPSLADIAVPDIAAGIVLTVEPHGRYILAAVYIAALAYCLDSQLAAVSERDHRMSGYRSAEHIDSAAGCDRIKPDGTHHVPGRHLAAVIVAAQTVGP